MPFLRVVFAKDFGRIRRDPASLLISILIPLFVGILLKLLTSGGGQPRAVLLVADHDQSFVSSFLVGALGRGELADLVTAQEVKEAEGRRLLNKGEASGLLIIPEGFGEAVFDREPTTLSLITNPAQRILPGILEEVLSMFVGAINLGGDVLGPGLDPMLDRLRDSEGVPPDALVGEFSVEVNRVVRRVEPYLLPPVIRVETAYLEESAADVPERSFGDIFFPGMFFLAVIFVAQSLSDDLWKEKSLGTLRRTLTTPGNLPFFLLGKLLAAGALLLVISVLALSLARWGLRLPFTGIPLAALWAAISGVFMLLFFTLLQLLAGSQRGGNLLTNAVMFPLVMAGGAFFPFEAMPEWLARVGRLTPNGWALLRFREILDGDTDPGALAVTFAALLGLSLVLFLLSLARLRRFAWSA